MLASEFPHCDVLAQRIGIAGRRRVARPVRVDEPVGGVSANETVPLLVGAPVGLFWPSVVQASVKALPFVVLTVTFSFVGVGL